MCLFGGGAVVIQTAVGLPVISGGGVHNIWFANFRRGTHILEISLTILFKLKGNAYLPIPHQILPLHIEKP